MQNKQAVSFKEATGVIQYNMTNDYMFLLHFTEESQGVKGSNLLIAAFRT